MTATLDQPPPAAVCKSELILARVDDDVARYMARVTGVAVIDGQQVRVYDPVTCDWIGCHHVPLDRFCAAHRVAQAALVRARLIRAARARRAQYVAATGRVRRAAAR